MSDDWHIVREGSWQIVSGGYSTREDALRARDWVERVYKPETFWVLSDDQLASQLREAADG